MREALVAGADVIKVVMDVEARVLTLDETKAIVEEALRSNGVDSIEHADEGTDAMFQAMRERNIFLGATDWPAEIRAAR